VKEKVEIIFVDDNSSRPLTAIETDVRVEIYKIKDDLGYATPAALNLGFMQAFKKYRWAMCMDSDCVIEGNDISKLLNAEVATPSCQCACKFCIRDGNRRCSPPHLWYQFRRRRVTADPKEAKVTRPLGCAFLLEDQVWRSVHGFDEDFTGEGYGFFDNHFTGKVQEKYGLACTMHGVKITEYMQSRTGPNVQTREGVEDEIRGINKRLLRLKQSGKVPPSDTIINFRWERIQ
jgi:hypothetical protein